MACGKLAQMSPTKGVSIEHRQDIFNRPSSRFSGTRGCRLLTVMQFQQRVGDRYSLQFWQFVRGQQQICDCQSLQF